jgi:hypothetical protein
MAYKVGHIIGSHSSSSVNRMRPGLLCVTFCARQATAPDMYLNRWAGR